MAKGVWLMDRKEWFPGTRKGVEAAAREARARGARFTRARVRDAAQATEGALRIYPPGVPGVSGWCVFDIDPNHWTICVRGGA